MSAVKRRNNVIKLNRRAKPDEVSEDRVATIRRRAFEIFLARGATHGADLADWFKAEQELTAADCD